MEVERGGSPACTPQVEGKRVWREPKQLYELVGHLVRLDAGGSDEIQCERALEPVHVHHELVVFLCG